ncbi:MAG: hypothetical protein BWK77_07730, partial [Verrucomicrobia bacterium A1]
MADIVLICPGCNKETRFSEYAAEESTVCPTCGATIKRPATEKSTRLKIRRIEHSEQEARLSGKDAAKPSAQDNATQVAASASTVTQMRSVLGNVHKARTITKGPSVIWAWVGFLLLSGLLVGWQYQFKGDRQLMGYYYWIRNGVGGIFWLMVMITAFEDTMTQGMLCLLLPFYIVYYVFVRLEMYWLRGVFAGVFVGICAEMYFIPNEALLTYAQGNLNV